MGFTNSLFFSYRHLPAKGYTNLVNDIYESLAETMVLRFGQRDVVFRDKDRMKPGAKLNPTLAANLCQSVCMVMIYVPPYFDEFATYCAREYKAMLTLEGQRLDALEGESRNEGLIIPIVCQDWNRCPKEIKEHHLACNFEDYFLATDFVSSLPPARQELKKIGSYIADRFEELSDRLPDACAHCPKFNLPSDEEIKPWVRGMRAPRYRLPGRSGTS